MASLLGMKTPSVKRIVLLHRPARHEPAHVREFREAMVASLAAVSPG